MTLFKRSTIALLVSLSFSSFASNPHPLIKLTPDIAQKYSGKNVSVGVVDAGFILDHPVFDNSLITSLIYRLDNPLPDGAVDEFDPTVDIIETEIVDGDNGNEVETEVYVTHGGQVSALINGSAINADGFGGGVAQNAHIYAASMDSYDPSVISVPNEDEYSFLLDETDEALYERERYAAAIDAVAQNGVLAINNSWNEDPFGDKEESMDAVYKETLTKENPLIASIDNAISTHNSLMVFAAGNESSYQPGVMAALPRYFPEFTQHYLSVIATNTENELEEYSNYCGVSKHWCIAAPGTLSVPFMDGANEGERIPDFEILEGTSYSAPVVTGSLAILKERFPYMTSTQIRDTLLTTATDLGDKGVDSKFGWGVVNIEQAIKGPTQLLKDETYQLSTNDTWSNHFKANNFAFTKSGKGTLTLKGKTQLNNVEIKEGRLNFAGQTEAHSIDNKAELGISNQFTGQITGNKESLTHLSTNANWQMAGNSSLGSLSMDDNSVITLNSAFAKNPQHPTAYNVLTILDNLKGSGQFNLLTNLGNWQGDKIIVEGIATGSFKLNVDNIGAEPTSLSQLSLLKLKNAEQSKHKVAVSLTRPVDFGAYRYELLNNDYDYRLYNPRKEKELDDARKAEEARKREEQRKQAELISRYSNTALSALSAEVNNLFNIGQTLDKRLFKQIDKFNVWSNIQSQKDRRESENYRRYKQNTHLTQIGAQAHIHKLLDIGMILSHSKSTANFANEGAGKSTLHYLTAFTHSAFDNNVVFQSELSMGKAQNRLVIDGIENKFKRNIFQAGLSLGYNWQFNHFTLQPSIAGRYYRLQGTNYRLNQNQIKNDSLSLLTYQVGLSAEQEIKWDDFSLTPSLSAYYVDSQNKKQTIEVNNAKLTQQFGRYINYEAKVGAKWKNWELSTAVGEKKGNETLRQRYWNINLGYHW